MLLTTHTLLMAREARRKKIGVLLTTHYSWRAGKHYVYYSLLMLLTKVWVVDSKVRVVDVWVVPKSMSSELDSSGPNPLPYLSARETCRKTHLLITRRRAKRAEKNHYPLLTGARSAPKKITTHYSSAREARRFFSHYPLLTTHTTHRCWPVMPLLILLIDFERFCENRLWPLLILLIDFGRFWENR